MKLRNRILGVVTTLALLSTTTLPAQTVWDGSADTDWAGDGSSGSPYLISSAAELAGLAKRTNADETFEGKHFRLTADIYLSDTGTPADDRPLWTPIGSYGVVNDSGSNPGGFYKEDHYFMGTFDGDGHTIHNLWYNGTTDWDDWDDPFGSGQIDFSAWYKALFGCMDGATIKNLRLENANIAGSASLAGLVILAKNSTFTDIHIIGGGIKSGDLNAGGSAAGLASEAENCIITDCSSSARVYGYSNTGGLIGRAYGSTTITGCSASGEAAGSVNSGGFIGAIGAGVVVTDCFSTAPVTQLNARKQGNNTGGFAGHNAGLIKRCHSTGDVKGWDSAAGFIHTNYGRIESCYATGNVTADDYGTWLAGFVSENGINLGVGIDPETGVIINCFATGKVWAPAPPSDIISSGTHLGGFSGGNEISTGSYMANCYWNITPNPDMNMWGVSAMGGEYAVTEDYMKSGSFVRDLNAIAQVAGTNIWQAVDGDYPEPTDRLDAVADILFAGGDGTAGSPFLVTDKNQLANLAWAANRGWEFRDQYLRQTADIALNAPQDQWGEQMPEVWTPIAATIAATDISCDFTLYFSGNYDGDFHTVSNMYIDDFSGKYAGLFGCLGGGAVISNLGVTDAWVNGDRSAGILAGAFNEHNTYNRGDRRIIGCWTSGQVKGLQAGAIVGAVNCVDTDYLLGCYSTAECSGQALTGDANAITGTSLVINGCYYAGKCSDKPFVNARYFWTFIDNDLNKLVFPGQYYDFGRTTEYMQSRRMVNDLNYAAAARGIDVAWRYTADSYPTFSGEDPTVTVTVVTGPDISFSFKAFKGSLISKPTPPTREGEQFLAWFTDAGLTQAFDFERTTVEADITLYPAFAEPAEADYSIFKNKFAKTFTITTPAQFLAFANIVNGQTDEVDKTDFAGKTVKLGNDIVLNDISMFDTWGTYYSPQAWPIIGVNQSSAFNGTFDGQGYHITGLYQSCHDFYNAYNPTYSYGLFGYAGASAIIRNVVLDHAFIELKQNGLGAALMVYSLDGTLEQCAAIGRIDCIGRYTAGLVYNANSGSAISQCYADITVNAAIQDYDPANHKPSFAGLVNTLQGSMADCYAVGNANFSLYGNYAGICNSAPSGFERCYAAVRLSWNPDMLTFFNIGGAYYSYRQQNTPSENGYYDRDLIENDILKLERFFSTPSEYENYAAQLFGRGIGLSTDNMKKMTSFADWDFNSVWGRRNDRNDGYPYLRWTVPGLDNDPDNDGIGSITTDDNGTSEAIYYNLNGLRISRPTAPGIYIVRQGGKTTKVAVR